MEINGLTVRIVDGKVDLNSITMMEDRCFGSIVVHDVERCHQAVGRLEMLRHKPMKFDAIDLIRFG